MKMHNPPHPGEILKELCLRPKGLSVTEVARALGVSRKTLPSLRRIHTHVGEAGARKMSSRDDSARRLERRSGSRQSS